MKLTSLLQLVDKLQQAGKFDNLQQVCGVFGCVDGVRNIADDIIVWGSTHQEHNLRLEQLFARLDESGLTVNNDKCLYDRENFGSMAFSLLIQA